MSIMLKKSQAEAATLSVEEVRQFLYREARFLDDKEWENWLELYAPDAEFWMPSWDATTSSSPIADADLADLVRAQGRLRG
jgi:3-phenylpropionate/cinnamic acid dioxygenase small subunit